MRRPKPQPLGFSDLTDDESFLIVIFRDWQSRGPTQAVAEHAIARSLKGDRFGAALDDIFRSFRSFARRGRAAASGATLLSETEEALLTDLSKCFGGALPDAGYIVIRPAYRIPRSGHDARFGPQNEAYWRAVASVARKPKRLN